MLFSVKDCHVSEWGPWSPCSAETCEDFGVEERHRVILGHPINGGLKCPHLLQSKQCQALPCEKAKPFHAGSNHVESWRQQENHHLQEEQNTFGGGNKGDEHNVLQSQQQKKQQKQSNQRGRKNKDNKNEVSKNKQHGEAFNKHYHSKQKHSNNKRRKLGQHPRQVWKGKKNAFNFPFTNPPLTVSSDV